MNYANGRLPLSVLAQVEPGQWLESATAGKYNLAKADASKAGITLRIAGSALHYLADMVPNPCASGAYRPYAMQGDMSVHPNAYGLDPHSTIPVAPEGSSTHGDGTSFDIVIGSARDWMIANYMHYGLTRPFGNNDPGHFHNPLPNFASTGEQPLITPEENNMDIYEDMGPQVPGINTGKFYAGSPGVWLAFNSSAFGGDPVARPVIEQIAGPRGIVGMLTGDLNNTGRLYLAMKPANMPGTIDTSSFATKADVAAILAAIPNTLTRK